MRFEADLEGNITAVDANGKKINGDVKELLLQHQSSLQKESDKKQQIALDKAREKAIDPRVRLSLLTAEEASKLLALIGIKI